jgi:predicted RNase H-like HicB family nuclease
MQHYAINVFWSDEDDAWVANVPDLKSCAAFGGTPEEAVAEVRIAMEAWLAATHDAGLPIPKPHYQPEHQAAE